MPRISRDTDIYPISLRELEVLHVEDLTPSMRRMTFGGPGLVAHRRDGEEVPPLISDGFDDDVRLILPDPRSGMRPYPRSLGDGRLDWNDEVNDLFRTYTVRAWRPESGAYGELVIDFARHGAGLAEGWSALATSGDKVFIAGPKNCGSHPSHTDWLLLIGDETALPAIGRCVEEAPAGHPVVAIVEVPRRTDIQQFHSEADLDLRWIVRDEGGDFTAEAQRLSGERESFPAGTPFVWAAGEAGRLKKIRAVVKEAAVPREHVQIIGYWRRNDHVDTENLGDDLDGGGTAGTSSLAPLMELHELVDLAPGLAARAAVHLGLFDAVDTLSSTRTGTPSVADVASERDLEGATLLRFLRYLESIRLVTLTVSGDSGSATRSAQSLAEATGVQLTALGRELADPEGLASHLTGPEVLRDLAWLHLADALRTATPVPVGATGATWAELRRAEPAIVESLADAEISRAQWVAPALAQSFDQIAAGMSGHAAPRSVVIAGAEEGTSAAVYADELLRRHRDIQVTILDVGAGSESLSAQVGPARRGRLTIVPWDCASTPEIPGVSADMPADLVLLIDPYSLAAPEEVPSLLSAVSGVSSAVVLITQLLAESGDEDHDYEEDITRLLLTGRSVPTARDLSGAIAVAGLSGVTDLTIGWGTHAVVATHP